MITLAKLRELPMQLVLLATVFQTSQAAMAAWMTDKGPQVVLQNMTTGDFTFSDCNAGSSAIYSGDPSNSVQLQYEPKKGTALAGVGWYSPAVNPYNT